MEMIPALMHVCIYMFERCGSGQDIYGIEQWVNNVLVFSQDKVNFSWWQ